MKPRIVNKDDRRRLMDAIQVARRSWITYGPYLDWLNGQLEEATAVEASLVPGDVVTMDSRVELADLRTGRSEAVALVYPDQEAAAGTVSVFEPEGLALLGSRVGDVVGWSDHGLSHTARVERLVYQPETAGVA
jgi:regulator of nucleoside diphosphate kinase